MREMQLKNFYKEKDLVVEDTKPPKPPRDEKAGGGLSYANGDVIWLSSLELPETWNMKVGDFIETSYKEKPQALLDLQEQNRKQTFKYFTNDWSGLMDESLDFIRRDQLAFGGKINQREVWLMNQEVMVVKNLI